MDVDIESIAASIVREFLSRKKCKEALEQMDDELPRNERSINNRSKLSQALSIENWMHDNKSLSSPYRTMLEIILYNIVLINTTKKPELGNDHFKTNKPKLRLTRPSSAQPSTLRYHQSMADEKGQFNNVSVEDLEDINGLDAAIPIVKPIKMQTEKSNSTKLLTTDLPLKFVDEDLSFLIGNKSNQHNARSLDENKSSRKNEMSVEDLVEKERVKSKSVFEMLSASPEKALLSSKKKPLWLSDESANFGNGKANETKRPNPRSKSSNPVFELPNAESQITRPNTVSFDFETAKSLRNLLFGSTVRGFTGEWLDQNFAFWDCTDRPDMLRFGIVQKKGGPCGVLAAMQAVVLKHLLFGEEEAPPSPLMLNVCSSTRTNCLVEAITEMIWRCGGCEFAALAVLSPRKQFQVVPHQYKPDGVTESVIVLNFTTISDLRFAVQQNIQSYEKGKASCILLLYSVILSRGIDTVRSDMDDLNGKLMGAHGYCTQEMINLLLVGRATSNAFDNNMKLDESTLLKGVHVQSDIGLLSLFEHYGCCKIGSHYKSPRLPIWVVCSESHFTVLFGFSKNLVSQFSGPKSFDLYYYDGLANQDEVIRLTIDTSVRLSERDLKGDLVPPLEHCIRTKWVQAKVDWNDTDPIL